MDATILLKKTSKPSHVGIHWIALVEYSHKYYLSSQFVFLHHFVLTNLATTSIRVKLIFVSYLFGLSITRILCSLRGVACMDYFVFNCSKCRLECYICIDEAMVQTYEGFVQKNPLKSL